MYTSNYQLTLQGIFIWSINHARFWRSALFVQSWFENSIQEFLSGLKLKPGVVMNYPIPGRTSRRPSLCRRTSSARCPPYPGATPAWQPSALANHLRFALANHPIIMIMIIVPVRCATTDLLDCFSHHFVSRAG